MTSITIKMTPEQAAVLGHVLLVADVETGDPVVDSIIYRLWDELDELGCGSSERLKIGPRVEIERKGGSYASA